VAARQCRDRGPPLLGRMGPARAEQGSGCALRALLPERVVVVCQPFGLVPAALVSLALHRSLTYALVHCAFAVASLGFHRCEGRHLGKWKVFDISMMVCSMYAMVWSQGMGGPPLAALHVLLLAFVLSRVPYDVHENGAVSSTTLFALAAADTLLSASRLRLTLVLLSFACAAVLRRKGMNRYIAISIHCFYTLYVLDLSLCSNDV